jgi:hypothetical protein
MTRPGCIEVPRIVFRLGKPDDVEPLLDRYGQEFFDEGGFNAFAVFDKRRAAEKMRQDVMSGATPFVLAEVDGAVAGMISYSLEHTFTTHPIAMLWMFYVMPRYRRSAPMLGRMLLWLALDMARNDDACAFFAVVPPRSSIGRTLGNLFRRAGFDVMGGAFVRGF